MKRFKIVLSIIGILALVFMVNSALADNCSSGKKTTADNSDCSYTKTTASKSDCGSKTIKTASDNCGSKSAVNKASAKADCAPANCGEKVKNTALKEVDTAKLSAMLAANEVDYVLDARSAEYDDGQRLPGAMVMTAGLSADEVAGVIPAKDNTIVTYCSSVKCSASSKLASHLRGLGYTNVIEYPEGLAGWQKAGNKIEKVSKNVSAVN